jgi:hypothetical protein
MGKHLWLRFSLMCHLCHLIDCFRAALTAQTSAMTVAHTRDLDFHRNHLYLGIKSITAIQSARKGKLHG